MDSDPIIVQAAIAVPISIGLALYTLLRWDRSPLHMGLAGLLFMVSAWLGALVTKQTAEAEWVRVLALDVEFATIAIMAPAFLITMGYFARSAVFEQSRAAALSVFAASALFYVAYLTDAQHGLFFSDRDAALAGEHPGAWGGSIYWALQIWCAICDVLAFAFCGVVLKRSRTRAERGRPLMVLAAVAAPVLAHLVYVLEIFPLEFSLAPGALGATAIFFVQGVHRYGLLEDQPIVRLDLIEHLEDGLLLADRDGVVIDANAAAETTLHADRAALRGQPLADVLAVLDGGEATRSISDRIVSLPMTGAHLGDEIRATDGRWIEIRGGTVAAVDSQPAGRFVSLRDRTRQRRNEHLLRERQKLESVGVLAAGVAHEVNNPLSYVRANLVHLQSLASEIEKHLDVEPDGEGSELLELPDILSESLEGLDRIARIVETMLRFSRESDELHRPIDLGRVIDEATRLASLQRDSSVHIENALPTELPLVSGSAERLTQVLLNLLLNAKIAVANHPEGRITTETEVVDNDVVVRVRDNGPGIPDDVQPRIFDPFFTTRPPDQGTGLGLSIAFDIVREHSGTLELESGENGGTCFTIRLPIASGAE